MLARAATPADAGAITAIYNQGIEERIATFETRLRTRDEIDTWFDGHHPIAVVEYDARVIAFAATAMYRPRRCYQGIAEVSVYVDRQFRGQGAGRLALAELMLLSVRDRWVAARRPSGRAECVRTEHAGLQASRPDPPAGWPYPESPPSDNSLSG